MKLKELEEKRSALLVKMADATEKREFDLFDSKNTELELLDREIKAEKRMRDLQMTKAEKREVVADVAAEIRSAINDNRELDLNELEVRAEIIGPTNGQNVSVGNIKKVTFADFIMQKLPYVSALYAAARNEVMGSSTHTIPVQKNKVGKFVKMSELQNYAAQNADFNTIKLEATKFGTMIVFSEEVIQDLGYNIEAELLTQLMEAYAVTLDELMIVGDDVLGMEGLNSMSAAKGAHEVVQATPGSITAAEILDIFYSVPLQYRAHATWTISDNTARELSKLTFADGTPVLFSGFGGTPVTNGSTILGRPVIINENVSELNEAGTSIYFGDLKKALIVAPRKALSIKKSTEFGFVNDSVAIKANVRLDIKHGVIEAMAIYTSKAALRGKK